MRQSVAKKVQEKKRQRKVANEEQEKEINRRERIVDRVPNTPNFPKEENNSEKNNPGRNKSESENSDSRNNSEDPKDPYGSDSSSLDSSSSASSLDSSYLDSSSSSGEFSGMRLSSSGLPKIGVDVIYDGNKTNFESSLAELNMYAVQAGLNEFLTSKKPTDMTDDGELTDFSGMRPKTKKALKKLLKKHNKACFMLRVRYPGEESRAWWMRSTIGETDSETALLAMKWPQGRSWLFFSMLEKMHRQQTYMDFVTVERGVLAIKRNPGENPDLMF